MLFVTLNQVLTCWQPHGRITGHGLLKERGTASLGWAGKSTCMNALSSLTDDVQVTVWKRDMQREKVAQTYGNTAQGAIQRYTKEIKAQGEIHRYAK